MNLIFALSFLLPSWDGDEPTGPSSALFPADSAPVKQSVAAPTVSPAPIRDLVAIHRVNEPVATIKRPKVITMHNYPADPPEVNEPVAIHRPTTK